MLYVKRAVSCLVFLCGLIALLDGSSYIFIPKNNTAENGMEEVSANGILGEEAATVDVIVIGDSESYSAVTPMQIWKEEGYTSYVCGTSGQTLDYSMTMVLRAFRTQRPKIVILETNAIYRKTDFSNATIAKLGNCFSVFRYHDRWKSLGKNDLSGTVKFTWTDDNKGFSYSKVVNPCDNTNYMTRVETAAQIPDLNRQYIQKIKSICDQNGAKLLFLSTPSPVNWNFERHNGVSKLAEELGCEYIDLNLLNKEVKINWEKDTRDKGDHLNYFGAKKVSHYLAGYLKQTGLLEDHREDSRYSKWNDALKRYELLLMEKGA